MTCFREYRYKRWILACISILIIFGLGIGASDSARATTAKDIYLQADKKYLRLKKNPKLQKYRDQWFACIDLFKAVYRNDPNGPWAAAGMYKTGKLYYELYKHSFKKSDKTAHCYF